MVWIVNFRVWVADSLIQESVAYQVIYTIETMALKQVISIIAFDSTVLWAIMVLPIFHIKSSSYYQLLRAEQNVFADEIPGLSTIIINHRGDQEEKNLFLLSVSLVSYFNRNDKSPQKRKRENRRGYPASVL